MLSAVLNLPDGQVIFFFFLGGGGGNSYYRRTVINPAHQIFFGLVEMTFGLVHVSCRLPEWQVINLTFFAPCSTMIFSVFKVVCPANIGHVNKPKPFRMLAAQTTFHACICKICFCKVLLTFGFWYQYSSLRLANLRQWVT